MPRVMLVVGMLGALLLGTVSAIAGIEESLDKAENLRKSAHFDEAIELLISTIEGADLDQDQAQRAYLLLAKCFYSRDNENEAKLWLSRLRDHYPCLDINAKRQPRPFLNLWYHAGSDSLCEREDPGIKHLAVVDFKNASIVDHDTWTPMQYGLADILITQLQQLSKLKVVDRERIQMILDEIDIQQSEYFDDKTAVRIGKMLGVHVFVMGSFMQLDKNTMVITPKLVKTETGEVLHSTTIKDKPDELMEMIATTAETIAGWLEVEVAEEEKEALHGQVSESVKAALAYSRGLLHEDNAEYDAAREAYVQALEVDSTYFPAMDRLAALDQ